jgi:catechol 2,3-dioxygenase-like lactoylglutathione lyase family enzyme
MENPPRIRVGAITILATRPLRLARFYSAFLGWSYLRADGTHPEDPDDANWVIVCPPEDVKEPALEFEYNANHRQPVWPTVKGQQTPTMHFDVTVDDLDTAVVWALECGATVAELQARPNEHRVIIDPDGHPICLCLP